MGGGALATLAVRGIGQPYSIIVPGECPGRDPPQPFRGMHMSRFLPRVASLILVLALQAALASPVSAQLGRLKKKAQEAVQGAVEAQLPFTPAAAPEFDDRVLEITGSLLDGLVRGFQAEVSYSKTASDDYKDMVNAHERDLKAYEKATEAYQKESEKWEACATEFNEKEAAAAAANEAKMDMAYADMDDEQLEATMMRLAERGEKLAKELEAGRNDPELQRQWEEYQRDSQIVTLELQSRAMRAMSGAVAEARRARTEDPRLVEACGKKPEHPVQPTSPLNGPEGVLATKGAEAAELTTAQYALMRERVMYWAQSSRRPKEMGFSTGEIDVLNQHADAVTDAISAMKKAKVPF